MITVNDLRKDLKNVPLELARLLVIRTTGEGAHTTSIAIELLQQSRTGGFTWGASPEGHEFYRQALWPDDGRGTPEYGQIHERYCNDVSVFPHGAVFHFRAR